jgi:tripartite-type tricarboxylate transporter receptor subunit TctC
VVSHPELTRRAALARLGALAAPLTTSLALAPASGAAQEAYPSRTITIIVPFASSAPPATSSRVMADKLSKRLGQPVIVELRPGASTTIGAALAARARPDGYTLLYATNSTLTAAPWLFKKLSYDPIKDFSAITVMLESYFCILVRPEDAGLTLQALAERIRKDPVGNAMAGGSTTAEVSNKMFQNAAKLDHSYVRYNNPNMMNDLWGGRLGAVWSPMASALAFAKQGKAHIVAVTAAKRLPQLPNVPALSEVYPGVAVDSWSGYFVPSATPRPIVTTLYQHMAEVLKDPEIVQRNLQDGNQELNLPPEQSDAYVLKDLPRWRDMLQNSGIEPG